MRHRRGFTLLEMMIVAAIIAIGGAVAVAYFDRSSTRTELRGLTRVLVANLRSQLESDLKLTEQRLESLDCNLRDLETYRRVLRDILNEQREELARLRSSPLFTDEVLRKQADQLDLDEARLTGKM